MIYECLMCHQHYKKDNEEPINAISHGICKEDDCRTAYIMYASGTDSCLIEIIKKELEENESGKHKDRLLDKP